MKEQIGHTELKAEWEESESSENAADWRWGSVTDGVFKGGIVWALRVGKLTSETSVDHKANYLNPA